jgi:hypothetical protein
VTRALGNGTYAITATATDAAGNSSVASGTLTLIIDTTPPTVTLTASPGNSAHNPSAAFTAHATDNITPAAALVLTYSLDGGSPVAFPAGGNLTLTGLMNGPHTLLVQATDQAGNVGGATISWTVATPGPATPPPPVPSKPSSPGVSNDNHLTNINTPTFTGKATPGVTVTLYANGQALGSTVAGKNGDWSYTAVTPLADGAYSITATATSPSGSTSAASGALKLVIDTAPPVVTVSAFTLPPGLFDLPGVPITFSGKVSSPLAKVVSVSYTLCDSTGKVIATGSIKIAPDGSYCGMIVLQSPKGQTVQDPASDTLTVNVQDAAGNASSISTGIATCNDPDDTCD